MLSLTSIELQANSKKFSTKTKKYIRISISTNIFYTKKIQWQVPNNHLFMLMMQQLNGLKH